MTDTTKPKWVHPLVRKMKEYRARHPDTTEDDMDEMFGGVFGISRRTG